ncbi:hypothetical protein OG883_00315 [Streptomyces sp. NBC_01142]|nr:hypothetical protein [Streptomyces sp. NBC_01142]MCX4818375.1 hypothetical protein [Streptomyces sp. NBC_01142]
MKNYWGRVIREALQSGDGTLRLIFLLGFTAVLAMALMFAARAVGLV